MKLRCLIGFHDWIYTIFSIRTKMRVFDDKPMGNVTLPAGRECSDCRRKELITERGWVKIR